MGQITTFNLENFINKFDTKIYFETGTGECVSLDYATKFNFKKFYSVDLDEDLYKSALNRFQNKQEVVLINNYSTKALEELLPIMEKDVSVLFFLDAHFPGADFHKMTYEESIRQYQEEAFPLENELRIIKSLRDISKDVFIIDDFVLYDKDKNYESIKRGQVWQYEWLQQELNIKTESGFIFDLFSETHNFEKDYRHQGYLIMTPKL
jgi:hypothetical protein